MIPFQIIQGDCISKLRELPDKSVQCCVTSPPYWGLRDYGIKCQIGLEPTLEEYISNLVDSFREVKKVLRDDGVLWLNLGDSYSTGGRGHKTPGFSQKQLLGVPWRVALALQDDGWYLRSECIWEKPNCQPESVKDRPTESHEHVFLFSKNPKYYFDLDGCREPCTDESIARSKRGRSKSHKYSEGDQTIHHDMAQSCHPQGRAIRTVWQINTEGYPGSHYAVMPTALAERCIMLATPQIGSCPQCGAPWQRIRKKVGTVERRWSGAGDPTDGENRRNDNGRTTQNVYETEGWKPSCQHIEEKPVPAVVLDPFGGAATTAIAAIRNGRAAISVELNPEYCDLGRKRISEEVSLIALDQSAIQPSSDPNLIDLPLFAEYVISPLERAALDDLDEAELHAIEQVLCDMKPEDLSEVDGHLGDFQVERDIDEIIRNQ